MLKKSLLLILGCTVMSAASAGDWVHVNSRNGYYGNINHAYVSPSSVDGNGTVKVMEVIENGPRHGNYVQYRMQADCSDGTVRVVTNIQWFNAEQNFLDEKTPSNIGWHNADGEKDAAVWNYICK